MHLPHPPLKRPFAGLTIVESCGADAPLALGLAAALAGRIAADLGARVIKLEPEGGDPIRRVPPLVGAESALFAALNCGKELGCAAGERGLIAGADVAIVDDGLARGLTERPPILAVLSLVAPGAECGPASEFTLSAIGGLIDIVGDPERQPLKLGGHQAAFSAGLAAFTGIAAALCRPAVNGRPAPETVRVSLLDAVVWLNWKSAPLSGSVDPPPTRSGPHAEWPIVRCADGWVALVYQENDWPALKAIVGDARLDHPDFADRAGRLARAEAFQAIVEQRFVRLTRRELLALALQRRVPIGPVWSPEELQADPHNRARELFAPIRLDRGPARLLPRLPVLWGGEAFPPGAPPAGVALELGVGA